MKGYIGYIRVSTVKQGTKGVSLPEQHDAILRYAERNQYSITIWLEETETAAKTGRPVFAKAVRLMKQRKVRGIILHKLDRGARNLRDWATLGELSDHGAEVHFVTENIDLQSRGGRLSADIQAVVAADYIRNLKEETRKGFYGRLKQGLYPLRAPIGYLDQGAGKAKIIDPIMGPMVRKAFELYASGRYTLNTLSAELHKLGLRNRFGNPVSRNGLSKLLNNPFYFGLIQLQKNNESFVGIHEPLVNRALFERAQAILSGKIKMRGLRHDFLFRQMLKCAHCGYSLIGERQKGHIYYRCHYSHEPKTGMREEVIEREVSRMLQQIQFNEHEMKFLAFRAKELRTDWGNRITNEIRHSELQHGQIKDRLTRLTDAYLDQALDREMFEERKHQLLRDQKSIEEKLFNLRMNQTNIPDRLEKFLELAGNAWLSYQLASVDQKRELLKIVSSNRLGSGKNVVFEPSIAFAELLSRSKSNDCSPNRDTPRTLDQTLEILAKLNAAGQLPDLKAIQNVQRQKADTDDEDITALTPDRYNLF